MRFENSVDNLPDDGVVDVWISNIDKFAPSAESLFLTLNSEEITRADAYKFALDRERFVRSRGLLRCLACHYLKQKPNSLIFDYGKFGKPFLKDFPGLRFNLSHAERYAVFAFTHNRDIGVDVEYARQDIEILEIASRFFSANEYDELRRIPESFRLEAFLNCWTRKEAFIKAIGDGLSFPLDKFEVSLNPDEPARLRKNEVDPGAVSKWTIRPIPIGSGYVGAVAVEGPVESISFLKLDHDTLREMTIQPCNESLDFVDCG